MNRSLHKESCNEVIELALSIPETQLVAVGPESCLRVLFFRAARKNLVDRFNMLFTESLDFVTGSHVDALKNQLESIIAESTNQAVIIHAFVVYISCADILMGTDFSSVVRYIEKNYQIPVKIFQRGPFSKRQMLPKERLGLIFADIAEHYRETKDKRHHDHMNAINILGEEKILSDSSLFEMIARANFVQIIDLADLSTFEQFLSMCRSCQSIITHPFALSFAQYLEENHRIPYLYLPRSKNWLERRRHYQQLAKFLRVEDDYPLAEQDFKHYLKQLPEAAFQKKIAVGLSEASLETALTLLELGFNIRVILDDSVSVEEQERLKGFNEKEKIWVYTDLDLLPDIIDRSQPIDVAIGTHAIHCFPMGKKIEYMERYDIGFGSIKKLIGEIL